MADDLCTPVGDAAEVWLNMRQTIRGRANAFTPDQYAEFTHWLRKKWAPTLGHPAINDLIHQSTKL